MFPQMFMVKQDNMSANKIKFSSLFLLFANHTALVNFGSTHTCNVFTEDHHPAAGQWDQHLDQHPHDKHALKIFSLTLQKKGQIKISKQLEIVHLVSGVL